MKVVINYLKIILRLIKLNIQLIKLAQVDKTLRQSNCPNVGGFKIKFTKRFLFLRHADFLLSATKIILTSGISGYLGYSESLCFFSHQNITIV